MHQPGRALALARANWDVQREPADARILLEASLAAHRPDAAQPVLAWLRTNGVQDIRLARLAASLAAHRPDAAQPVLAWLRTNGVQDIRLARLADSLGKAAAGGT